MVTSTVVVCYKVFTYCGATLGCVYSHRANHKHRIENSRDKIQPDGLYDDMATPLQVLGDSESSLTFTSTPTDK